MSLSTDEHAKKILKMCRKFFEQKHGDYGTSWRILRPLALTDQIFIKAKRIRSIQEKGQQKVQDSFVDEFIGIINYSIMAVIQLEVQEQNLHWTLEKTLAHYDAISEKTIQLMGRKNHDYGEAWRDMRVESITDIILMKLLRIRSIETNQGKTQYSEGTKEVYKDIINYAIFALIHLGNQ